MNEKQKKYFDKSVEAIKKNKLIFVEDVIAYIGIAKSTFYEYFPIDSNESNVIKELLDKNKIDLKSSMRSKWYKSNAPALQIALYKMLSTDEEMAKLSMQQIDHTTKGESINVISLGGGKKPE